MHTDAKQIKNTQKILQNLNKKPLPTADILCVYI